VYSRQTVSPAIVFETRARRHYNAQQPQYNASFERTDQRADRDTHNKMSDDMPEMNRIISRNGEFRRGVNIFLAGQHREDDRHDNQELPPGAQQQAGCDNVGITSESAKVDEECRQHNTHRGRSRQAHNPQEPAGRSGCGENHAKRPHGPDYGKEWAEQPQVV
jgi:hypothetical protein